MSDIENLISFLNSECDAHAEANAGMLEPDAKVLRWSAIRLAAKELARLTAECAELRKRRDSATDYAIDLQRIIEAICHGNALPQSTLHHREMAAKHIAECDRLRRNLKHYQDKVDPYEPANKQQLDDMAAHVNEVHALNRELRAERDQLRAELRQHQHCPLCGLQIDKCIGVHTGSAAIARGETHEGR